MRGLNLSFLFKILENSIDIKPIKLYNIIRNIKEVVK